MTTLSQAYVPHSLPIIPILPAIHYSPRPSTRPARDRRVPSSYSSQGRLTDLTGSRPSFLNSGSPPSVLTVAPTSAEESRTTFFSTPFTSDCWNDASQPRMPPSSHRPLARRSRFRASSLLITSNAASDGGPPPVRDREHILGRPD
eukprot:5551630-Pleurochrysis_carterae.AAC.1